MELTDYCAIAQVTQRIKTALLRGSFNLRNHATHIHFYYGVPICSHLLLRSPEMKWVVVIFDKEVPFKIRRVILCHQDSLSYMTVKSVEVYCPSKEDEWAYFRDAILGDEDMAVIQKTANYTNFTREFYIKNWKMKK